MIIDKLATKYTFKFNSRFSKQVDGWTIGGLLFVTFSDIYMVKMEYHLNLSFIADLIMAFIKGGN